MLPWLTYCILILFCATARVCNMSFILSLIFSTFFTKKYTANHRSCQCFLCVICPLYYQYCNWENSYKKDTAVCHVCQPPFFDIFVPILSIDFCTFLSRYSTFFIQVMLEHLSVEILRCNFFINCTQLVCPLYHVLTPFNTSSNAY